MRPVRRAGSPQGHPTLGSRSLLRGADRGRTGQVPHVPVGAGAHHETGTGPGRAGDSGPCRASEGASSRAGDGPDPKSPGGAGAQGGQPGRGPGPGDRRTARVLRDAGGHRPAGLGIPVRAAGDRLGPPARSLKWRPDRQGTLPDRAAVPSGLLPGLDAVTASHPLHRQPIRPRRGDQPRPLRRGEPAHRTAGGGGV